MRVNSIIGGCLILYPVILQANDLALPGFTGVIRTPSAGIATQGEFRYQYNNYDELSGAIDNTFNHVFTVGVTPYLEVGGRLTDWSDDDRVTNPDGTLPGVRDLSGNLKIKVPKLHPSLPDMAFGAQDFAGEAVNFRSVYGVASKRIGKSVSSLGYAQSDSGGLDGEFASFEYSISPDLSFKADYLDKTFAVGVGLDAKRLTGVPVSLLLAGEENAQGDWDGMMGVSLNLPLAHPFTSTQTLGRSLQLTFEGRDTNQFIAELEQYGISRARLGKVGAVDIVTLHNDRYNHSYLDALSVVMGNAYRYLSDKETLRIVLTKQGSPLIVVQINLRDYGRLINDEPMALSTFKKSTKAWFPAKSIFQGVSWVKASNRYGQRPIDLRLQPELRSNVGSEWGVFDYSAAIRADLAIPVGNIADLLVSGSIPVANSDLYDDGAAFAGSRHSEKINHAVVQSFTKPSPTTTLLSSLGYTSVDDDEFWIAQMEGGWSLSGGRNQFFAKAAHLSNKNDGLDHSVALGGVRHHFSDLSSSAALSYGQFYDETRGVKFQVSKFYGDTKLSAELKYAEKDDISGGLTVSLPLTPRRDRSFGNTIVRGSQSWSYGIDTTIKDPVVVGSNRVRPNFMLDPSLSHTLEKDYLDSNRLSPKHFINNLYQLKKRSIDLLANN